MEYGDTFCDHHIKKIGEKSWECHNHKPQPFSDTKRKRKQTKPNKRKSNKRIKSTKISSLCSLFPEVYLSKQIKTRLPRRNTLTITVSYQLGWYFNTTASMVTIPKKVREKSSEFHHHKLQPIPDTKRKRKQTKPNKRKSNKRTKSTNISSLP